MTLQIIGTKKDNNTQKALRYFKERNVEFQFRDLTVKPLSAGELNNICRSVTPEDLIDTESKVYKNEGYAYRDFDPLEELLEKPLLLRQPVVRAGSRSAAGYFPDVWENMIS